MKTAFPRAGNGNHSGILAWRISWIGELGGLWLMRCKQWDVTEWLTHTQVRSQLQASGERWLSSLDLETWVDVRYILEVNQRTWWLISLWGMRRREGSGMSNGHVWRSYLLSGKDRRKADLKFRWGGGETKSLGTLIFTPTEREVKMIATI